MPRTPFRTCLAIVLAALVWPVIAAPALAQDLPRQLSDETFRKVMSEFSEPDGYFQYENFVSNEDDYVMVLPALKKTVKLGGVLIGVGPEQNFTYIGAFKPGIAFIIDIRRQNMLEHLLYKALFEMSSNRNEFVSKLFSRTPVTGLNTSSTARMLFEAYERAQPNRQLYDSNLAAIYDRLTKTHGFQLSNEDKQGIAKVYTAFFQGGPQMDYRFNSYSAPTPSASYTQLMDAADRDGQRWSYLQTEENFQVIRDYEAKNLIVPLVGDFAGPKAIRAVGQYAKEHKAIVSVFYTSNVDEYLFRDSAKERYFSSIATLPMDASSAMIRAVGGPGGLASGDSIQIAAGKRWAALRCSMPDLLKAYSAGKIPTRVDANRMCSR